MTKFRASNCPQFPHSALYVTSLLPLMKPHSSLLYSRALRFLSWIFYYVSLHFSQTLHCVSLSCFLNLGLSPSQACFWWPSQFVSFGLSSFFHTYILILFPLPELIPNPWQFWRSRGKVLWGLSQVRCVCLSYLEKALGFRKEDHRCQLSSSSIIFMITRTGTINAVSQ